MSQEMTISCFVYKSPRRDQLYLYLTKEDDFSDVPEGLMQGFGAPQRVMTLELTPERPLARADVREVMAQLSDQGYYLQIPPAHPALS